MSTKKSTQKQYRIQLGGISHQDFKAEDDLAALRMTPRPWQLFERTGDVVNPELRPVLDEHLRPPPHLDHAGQDAHSRLLGLLVRLGFVYTGGCKAFWSPREWSKQGEPYGRGAKLIVMYDGGEVGQLMNGAHDSALVQALAPLGLYAERCTHYYSAIYPIREATPETDPVRCHFADCMEGHPLAPEDAAPTDITCGSCIEGLAEAGEG